MLIKKAKSYGFCFGVKRAIDIAEHTKEGVTYGPLIHNPLEIERLRKDFNVGTVENIDDVETKTVIIRTHGVTQHDLTTLKEKEKEIIDATCPFVKKPQKIVKEMSLEGYDIVIFGDQNHPEVKGVASYATHKRVFITMDLEKLRTINLKERVAIVSQTTKKIEEFLAFTDYLIQRTKEVRVFNTICNATFENQDATKLLSEEADVMIVVGGKNSSNTRQLYTIAKEQCQASYLIEDAHELKKEFFDNKEICGITAGASTPEWLIEKIITKIQHIKDENE